MWREDRVGIERRAKEEIKGAIATPPGDCNFPPGYGEEREESLSACSTSISFSYR